MVGNDDIDGLIETELSVTPQNFQVTVDGIGTVSKTKLKHWIKKKEVDGTISDDLTGGDDLLKNWLTKNDGSDTDYTNP